VFKPTHKLTYRHHGIKSTVNVKVVDGVAYTRAEWDAYARADLELQDDGTWTFQGEPVGVLAVVDYTKRKGKQ
jgi:hypothetical protein